MKHSCFSNTIKLVNSKKFSSLSKKTIVCFFGSLLIFTSALSQVKLPLEKTYPFIYDNDSYEDVYAAEIAFFMAKEGIIDLQGVIHTNGGWRDPWDSTDFIYRYNFAHASGLVEMARRSGLGNIPEPVLGNVHPIVDKPEYSEGAKAIINIVNNADSPVIFYSGGPVSTLADAYLMDNSIADKVIVLWLGYKNWNGLAEEFKPSADIVLKNFTCVLFLSYRGYAPVFTKSIFVNLPHTELTQFMVEKELPHVNLPELILLDGLPLVPLLTDDFVTKVKRFEHGGRDKNGEIVLIENLKGNLYDVIEADPVIGAKAVWNLMNNCNLQVQSPFIAGSDPYHGTPFQLPGKLEAEHFDHGGQGFGYFDVDFKSWSETKSRYITTFRPETHVDFIELGDPGKNNFAVTRTQTCEWLNYKINVVEDGKYQIRVRLSGIDKINHITKEVMPTAGIKLLVDGQDVSGILEVPVNDTMDQWTSISAGNIYLKKGIRDFRIFIYQGNMSIDFIEFVNIN